MKAETISEILKKGKKSDLAEGCAEWLIAHDYVYSPVFGWEKANVVEHFNLDPNLNCVPCEWKPKWVENDKKGKDKYGNSVSSGGSTAAFVQHPTEKDWYVADNYLAYMKFRKNRDLQEIAQKNIPLPTE